MAVEAFKSASLALVLSLLMEDARFAWFDVCGDRDLPGRVDSLSDHLSSAKSPDLERAGGAFSSDSLARLRKEPDSI